MSWTIVKDGNALQVRATLWSVGELEKLVESLKEFKAHLEDAEKPKGEKS